MPQHEIELILMRQLASYLIVPIFIVGTDGTLLFYNESAEAILGRRFEETGEMPADEWATAYEATDESGGDLTPADLPLIKALHEGRPAHGRLLIRGLDNVRRHIEITAFPLVGQADRHLGAVAIFWEVTPCK